MASKKEVCPECSAEDKKITVNYFGNYKEDLCSFCGYKYQEKKDAQTEIIEVQSPS